MFLEDLFLTNETAKHLYNSYAKDMPIIDYHCHLVPKEIWENKPFEDLGEMWLAHDHYKWRAMRTFGIDESYITGDKSFEEKFLAFAKIMPQLIGNPIYIWCALELKRYFNIDEALCEENAKEIYAKTKNMITEKNITPGYFIEKSKVQLVATTDDPVDSLEFHKAINKEKKINTKVIPAFRPDKAFYIEKPSYTEYINLLQTAADMEIGSFSQIIEAIERRLEYFKGLGSSINDNGIAHFTYEDYSNEEIENIFAKKINNDSLSIKEQNQYKTAFLIETAKLYHKHNFVMQLHIGTLKDTNSEMFEKLGADTGYDCIDDSTAIKSVCALLDKLNTLEILPKTILYPLNISQYETFAVLAAAFCKGGTKAKVQLGAPWWFNDQVYGITKQFESVSNLYPIALSVGMLTDSRSFLSYPRHELYRRVLCNYLGGLVERGEYFSSEDELKKIIENICYNNANEYFGFQLS